MEIDWFDCSKNTEKKNEDCVETLCEIIDSSPSTTKSKNRAVKKTEPKESIQDPSCSSRIGSDTKSTIGPSITLIKSLKKNHVNYLKYKGNPHFLLGLNSTLKYLENLRFILIQLKELTDRRHHANNQQEDDENGSMHGGIKGEELHDKVVLQSTDIDISAILRDLQTIKFIVVLKHPQHLSVIGLLSTFVNEINQALYDLNFQPQTTRKFIELVGFPVGLNPPLLEKFNLRRLSCFAILDSAPGIDRLSNFFTA